MKEGVETMRDESWGMFNIGYIVGIGFTIVITVATRLSGGWNNE